MKSLVARDLFCVHKNIQLQCEPSGDVSILLIFLVFLLITNVSDPHCLRIRIQHFRSVWIRIRILIQDFDEQKLEKMSNWKKFFIYFFQKLQFTYGIPWPPQTTSKLQKIMQRFKTWNFLTFSIFVGNICPPGSGSSRLKSMRIRIWIRNTGILDDLHIFLKIFNLLTKFFLIRF